MAVNAAGFWVERLQLFVYHLLCTEQVRPKTESFAESNMNSWGIASCRSGPLPPPLHFSHLLPLDLNAHESKGGVMSE